jgi:hypothetical protein
MLRFLLRHGAVRMIGGRAVPVLMLWDLAMLANRARKIPVVDRGLRRGAAATGRRVSSTLDGLASQGGALGPVGSRVRRAARGARPGQAGGDTSAPPDFPEG